MLGVFLWPQVSLEVILGSYCSGKLAVFTVLCEQYQPSLRRDPMYNEVRFLHWPEASPPGQQPKGGSEAGSPSWALRLGTVHLLTIALLLSVPRQDWTALLRCATKADILLWRLAR